MAKSILRWLVITMAVVSTSAWSGIDQVALAALEARIRSGEIPDIHAVVVVQHGETIA